MEFDSHIGGLLFMVLLYSLGARLSSFSENFLKGLSGLLVISGWWVVVSEEPTTIAPGRNGPPPLERADILVID